MREKPGYWLRMVIADGTWGGSRSNRTRLCAQWLANLGHLGCELCTGQMVDDRSEQEEVAYRIGLASHSWFGKRRSWPAGGL